MRACLVNSWMLMWMLCVDVDHRFLATVLETTRFKPEFHNWISMMYHNPQVVVQVNRKCLGAFATERSVWQSFSLSPFLYVLAWSVASTIYISKACHMIKLKLLTSLSVDICFIYYMASFSVDSVSEQNMP